MTGALRLSIGPVQGWIAAGRRTRDFWAGSFLLSWLSGQAMSAVMDAGGSITVPAVMDRTEAITDPTLAAVRRDAARPRPGPPIGTLVNHFRAGLADTEAARAAGVAATARVRERFSALARIVWRHFFEPAAQTHAWDTTVKERWDRQTSGEFFEILWVAGPVGDWREESSWIERRKSFRDHAPSLREGTADRCPVHGDLAELGGFRRQFESEAQDSFWKQARSAVARGVYGAIADAPFFETLEIRPGERLSALALVKRLFPLLPPRKLAEAIGWVPDFAFRPSEDEPPDWDPWLAVRALRNWPSTAFVAAIPWIVEWTAHRPDKAEGYADDQWKALSLDPVLLAERPQHSRIVGIDANRGSDGRVRCFAVIEGTLHFPRGLDKRRFGGDPNVSREIAETLNANFRTLVSHGPDGFPAAPSPFYALLDMDGDRMGEIFSVIEPRAKAGSRALMAFAAQVPAIIRAHDGVLIFAGADDVNAMLPVTTAIPCAIAIRTAWRNVMADEASAMDGIQPTISASLLFADYQNALDDMRRLAHHRLEQVAKTGRGRDALAIAVAKSGGVVAEWASHWNGLNGAGCPEALMALAAKFRNKSVASRLPYRIRAGLLDVLDTCGPTEAIALLAREISDSGIGNRDEAKSIAEIMHAAMIEVERVGGTPGALRPRLDGPLLARFLATESFWSHAERVAASAASAA